MWCSGAVGVGVLYVIVLFVVRLHRIGRSIEERTLPTRFRPLTSIAHNTCARIRIPRTIGTVRQLCTICPSRIIYDITDRGTDEGGQGGGCQPGRCGLCMRAMSKCVCVCVRVSAHTCARPSRKRATEFHKYLLLLEWFGNFLTRACERTRDIAHTRTFCGVLHGWRWPKTHCSEASRLRRTGSGSALRMRCIRYRL